MKHIVLDEGGLHIETPLGIVNIRVGLRDMRGRRVDSISVVPDDYSGFPKVKLSGLHNTRLIELKKIRKEERPK